MMSVMKKRWTDKKIIEFAGAFREGILGERMPTMMCFAICTPLVTLANMSGIKCEMVETDLGWCNHFWLRLADGRALDPSADQFNYLDNAQPPFPPVYLGPPTRWHGAV